MILGRRDPLFNEAAILASSPDDWHEPLRVTSRLLIEQREIEAKLSALYSLQSDKSSDLYQKCFDFVQGILQNQTKPTLETNQ